MSRVVDIDSKPKT